jgi:hypothetical protein
MSESLIPRLRLLKYASKEMGIPYTTMRDAHMRGELAVVRVGRAWYVTEDELRRFVEARTVRHGQG